MAGAENGCNPQRSSGVFFEDGWKRCLVTLASLSIARSMVLERVL